MVICKKRVKNDRKGRFICLVRQSDASEGTTSTEAQLKWMHDEGKRLGLVHVDDIILAGLTGSLPGKRDDLEGLLKRKRERDDFDVLLVQRCDRLTRGGSDHAAWFSYEAVKAGIRIIFPGEDIPADGNYRGMILASKFDSAREQAKSIGQRSVQGRMLSIADGRSSVVSRVPYGCDRLYLSGQGEELFIIRNLGDGRQLKLHPQTREVLDTYGTVGGGRKGHYRKQRQERPLLVPGSNDRVETVCLIFHQHYHEAWGGKRIADLLNRKGVLSPTGRGWSQRQVESIYENPVYCGWGLGRRTAQGIFYAQGIDAPIALDHDPTVLANCRTTPKLRRSPDDWIWEEQPRLRGLLPVELADKAMPLIKQLHLERWERSQDPTRPKKSTSKHKASEYILTGILFAKQDGAPLTGVLCGKVGKKTRYYRHRKGRLGYRKGSVFNKMVPAQALEDGILDLIQQIITNTPDLRERLIAALIRQLSSSLTQQQLDDLKEQRSKLAARLQLIVRTLDEDSLADVRPEIDRLAEQRRALDKQIAQAELAIQRSTEDPQTLADKAIARLNSLDLNWRSISPAARRDLVQQFVEKVEVDMATKEAEVSLRLPPWALQNGDWAMRLAHSSASRTVDETHPLIGIPLAYADCRYTLVPGRSVCYRCRRRAA